MDTKDDVGEGLIIDGVCPFAIGGDEFKNLSNSYLTDFLAQIDKVLVKNAGTARGGNVLSQ